MASPEYVRLRESQSTDDDEGGEEDRGPRRRSASTTVVRKDAAVGLLGILFLASCLVFSLLRTPPSPRPSYPFLSKEATNSSDEHGRKYGLDGDFPRDSWTMTEAQCDAAFHPLWTPLYESLELVQQRGGHTAHHQDQIERHDGNERELTCVRLVNNTLYLSQFHHSAGGSRTESAISLLERAVITSTEALPNARFCISTQDQPVPGTFALTRRRGQESVWLSPDFGFWAWPEPGVGSYVGFRRRARDVEGAVGGWSGKQKDLFWRGATWIGEERKVMSEVASKHSWGNVHNIDWSGPKKDGVHPDRWESMEGHCKHAFLASPEGLSYSGRLKYLQNCESVIFVRTPVYLQHWTHLFNANTSDELQNIVVLDPVHGDPTQSWQNAGWQIDDLIANDARAQRIAARSVEIFRDRYLSPAAVACYWRKAIRLWASSQRFTVSLVGDETPWEAFTAQFFKMHIPIS